MWELGSENVTVLTGHTDAVNAVRFLPASTVGGAPRALTTGRDGALIVWDLDAGLELTRLTNAQRPASSALYAIDVSPDGLLLAAGGDDQVVTVWNIGDSSIVATLRGHGRSIRAVAFSPDASRVVSGTVNGDIFLWDIATGETIRTFNGHNRTVHSLSFSPDGSSILSASIDGTIRVWDVESGFALRIYTLDDRLVTFSSVAFSEDGETILSGLSDGRLRLWRLYPTVESLLAWTLVNRHVPELTCDQRLQFRLPPFCDVDNPQIVRDVPQLPPLALLPETLLTLTMGDEAIVHVTAGDNLFLRSEPTVNSAETIVSRMPDGTRVTLLEGPLRREGFTWWRLRTENDNEGWAVAFLPNAANDDLGELQTLLPVDLFQRLAQP
jgi:WD40 repeat protein